MHLNKVFTFLLFLMLLTASVSITGCTNGQKQDSNSVAKIGDDYVITYNDLRKFVFERLYHKMYKDQLQAYNQALNVMVTNQLKCMDFLEKGLDENSELMQNIQRDLSEELLVKYFNTQFLDKYANEEVAHKIYDSMGKQVVYQQIVLYKPEKASTIQLDSLKNTASAIKVEIDKGIDFVKLVDKYSQHSESSNSDGYMPPLGWEQSLSNPVDNIIFNLNIGDVQVLDTYNAYRIVKVTDIKEIDIKPFKEVKNQIITKLRNSYIDISLREYDRAKNELIDINAIKWNDNTLDQLIAWSKIPNFYRDIYQDTIKNAISAGNNFTILTYSEGNVDLREYLRLLNNILIPIDTQTMGREDIKKFIIETLQTDKIVQKAKELHFEKDLLDPDKMNPILKNKIVNLYDQAVIESQIPEPTSEVLHKFYELQKDSLYYHLRKINIYAMIFPEKKKADEIMQRIKNGTPFEKISGRWFVKTFVRDDEGNIKSYLSTEKPFLGNAAFKLGLNETSGPIEYDDPEKGKQYAIIKCANIRPEKQLLFDDVKNHIAEDFKIYQRKKLTREIIQRLWKKYDIEIYKDILTKKLTSGN